MKKSILTVLAAGLVLAGCKTGMLAPRTGELFQTTRMCPGPGSQVYTAPLMIWVWGVQKRGGEWTIPIGIVGIPIAAAGFVVDECVVSPLVDLVCLPYDLSITKRCIYIRIVDEFGTPVTGVKVRGWIKKIDYLWSGHEDLSRTTDDAGEIELEAPFDIKGHIFVSHPDCASWWNGKDLNIADSNPGSDGRIVFQFVLPRANPGAWNPKSDISREDVLKLLPGKWTADTESRLWLQYGFNCKYANDLDRHLVVLDASGSVVARVPGGYEFYFGRDAPEHSYSAWRLEREGEISKSKSSRDDDGTPSDWTWRVHLFQPDQDYLTRSDNYYLGEDEKGVYLSPGPFTSWGDLSEKLSLKFRKVKE